VNDDFTLGLDFAEFVDGLTPVGGAVSRLGRSDDERRHVAVPCHLVSLALEDLFTVAVPTHLDGRVPCADAAAQHRLLRGHQRRVGEILQQLRRCSSYERDTHSNCQCIVLHAWVLARPRFYVYLLHDCMIIYIFIRSERARAASKKTNNKKPQQTNINKVDWHLRILARLRP